MPAVKLNFPRTFSSQGVVIKRGYWKAVTATVFRYFEDMAKERPGQFVLDKNKHEDEAPTPAMSVSEQEMWGMFKRMMNRGNYDHTEPMNAMMALEDETAVRPLPEASRPDPEKKMTVAEAGNDLDAEDESNFTEDGRPSQLALSAKLGRIVSQEEIDRAFPKNTGAAEENKSPSKVVIRKAKRAPKDELLDTGAGPQE